MNNTTPIKYDDLDDFTKAYIEAALWAETDNANESVGEPLDSNYDESDIDPDSLQIIYNDCKKFQDENRQYWENKESGRGEWNIDEQSGHDFWLTRNGHGAGFWDCDRTEIYGEDNAESLTDACKEYRNVYIEVGDDGKLHFR